MSTIENSLQSSGTFEAIINHRILRSPEGWTAYLFMICIFKQNKFKNLVAEADCRLQKRVRGIP